MVDYVEMFVWLCVFAYSVYAISRRSSEMVHVQAGSDSWDPTDAELRAVTAVFMDAKMAECVDENSNVIATAAYNLKSRLSVITTRRNINIVGTWSFTQDRVFAFVMAVTSSAMLCINLFLILHH